MVIIFVNKEIFRVLRAGIRLTVHRSLQLLRQRRCRLVVMAHEVGGRWSEEAWTFLSLLARVKAETAPAALRRSTEFCFLRRWAGFVAVAAQTAFAATLVGEPSSKTQAWNVLEPALGEVLCDRLVAAEGPSRFL